MRTLLCALALTTAFLVGAAAAQAPSLETWASDPNFRSADLSPDGRYVVGIRTDSRGDTLIRLDWRTGQAVVLQQVARGETNNQIDWVAWKSSDRLIMSISTTRQATIREDRSNYIRSSEQVDVGVSRIVAINADGSNLRAIFEGQTRNLAWGGVTSTTLRDVMPNDPDHVLVEAIGQNGLGLYRGNIHTGRTERLEDGGWDGGGWALDSNRTAVLRYESLRGGAGYRVYRRAPGESRWIQFAEFRGGEQTNNPDFGTIAPGPAPGQVWVYARPEGQDRSGLYLFDAATGQYGDAHYVHPRADFDSVWITPQNQMLAACAIYQREECQYFDADVGRHIRAVNAFFERAADVSLAAMSDDGNTWLVYVQGPVTTPSYYIYDRTQTAVLPVSATRPLTDEQLSPMAPVTYTSRDGTELWGYLTTPRSALAQGAPLVVFVHGGPEARDTYGFDREVQLYASRGYLVFQPQFRGSRGFGLQFAHAGRRQWGRRMQDDITDGVRHLIASGRVDPNRICIVGHSYGGYAALAGATLTPDLYRCAVGVNGVYDLREMLRWEAEEGGRRSAELDYWRNSIGDPNADRAAIEAASPRQQVGALQIPVLIVAAEQDWTVPVAQGQQMRDALRAAGKDFRYLEIPREGHSWYSWEFDARMQMLTEMDRFLAANLGQGSQ